MGAKNHSVYQPENNPTGAALIGRLKTPDADPEKEGSWLYPCPCKSCKSRREYGKKTIRTHLTVEIKKETPPQRTINSPVVQSLNHNVASTSTSKRTALFSQSPIKKRSRGFEEEEEDNYDVVSSLSVLQLSEEPDPYRTRAQALAATLNIFLSHGIKTKSMIRQELDDEMAKKRLLLDLVEDQQARLTGMNEIRDEAIDVMKETLQKREAELEAMGISKEESRVEAEQAKMALLEKERELQEQDPVQVLLRPKRKDDVFKYCYSIQRHLL